MSFKVDESRLVCSEENRVLEDIFGGVSISTEDAIALAKEQEVEARTSAVVPESGFSEVTMDAEVFDIDLGLLLGIFGKGPIKGEEGSRDIDPGFFVDVGPGYDVDPGMLKDFGPGYNVDPGIYRDIDPGFYLGDPSAILGLRSELVDPYTMGMDSLLLDVIGQAEKDGEAVDGNMARMRDSLIRQYALAEQEPLFKTDTMTGRIMECGFGCVGVEVTW
ncbi:MAG: hypothetical protein HN337_05755 [Deltaproteobacteria bacterium]|jgi:hypothetical protein|nr:hypothetical protein [Deltaproteobacteria bacterium]